MSYRNLLNRKLHDFLQDKWNNKNWFSTIMKPLSILTACKVKRRRKLFRKNSDQIFYPKIPVVIIGNIYLGGTGKTPFVIAAVKALQARGWKPGILSRGYGIKVGHHARVGIGNLSTCYFGDEPALISCTTGSPISVHPKRALAAKALLHRFPETDVIISDDGLQHLELNRDFEIIIQDDRGIGNGLLLPAGPLREPSERLNEANVIVTNRIAHNKLINSVYNKHKTVFHLDMWLEFTFARHVEGKHSNRPLSDFSSKTIFNKIAAAAGIGNPNRFFSSLNAFGIYPTTTLSLPDHYNFSYSPFKNITADAILITSKDSIKCSNFKDNRLWEIPVKPRFSNPYFFDYLSDWLTLNSKTNIKK
ncbi:MAG: tetraacyldisaccharide 4'-kinase [Bordetella sp.]|nr:MAG: tetraacyldisaccharide 4'-kinase [Bordetella sp.]